MNRKEKINKYFIKRMMIIGTISLLILGSTGSIINASISHQVQQAELQISECTETQLLIAVQVSRWTEGDEIVTGIEYWSLSYYNEFVEAMNSILYNEIRSTGEMTMQYMAVLQQFNVIPQDKTISDLELFLQDQYNQHQQTIEDYIDQQGESPGGDYFLLAALVGTMAKPFHCLRIPSIVYLIDSIGGDQYFRADYTCLNYDQHGSYRGHGRYAMDIYIWLGVFVPPVHNGINIGLSMARFCGVCFEGHIDFDEY